jgi:hypothetical protein
MSAAVQPFYAVQEATADPFAIRGPTPFRFVEMRNRIDTYVVLSGSVRIGTIRHDAGSGLVVAKANGCPNGSASADIHRNFEASRPAVAVNATEQQLCEMGGLTYSIGAVVNDTKCVPADENSFVTHPEGYRPTRPPVRETVRK